MDRELLFCIFGVKPEWEFCIFGFADYSIKATQTVAGKEYFESGANVVSETIIQGVTTVGSKVAEKVSDEILKR